MQRRTVVLLALVWIACRRAPRSFEEILPVEVSGGWKRGEVKKLAELPGIIAQLNPEESVEATYQGSGSIRVRAFRMKAEASAFEAMQKWRRVDGLAAAQGPYFFVAQSDGADPAAVMQFLNGLKRVNNVARYQPRPAAAA